MSLRFLSCVLLVASGFSQTAPRELRVCADPENLPYSDRAGRGFENRIAEELAQAMHRKLVYHWSRMGRGFVRNVLNKRECDLLVAVPANFRAVRTTRPYYRSQFVFVTRRADKLNIDSLDDPRLRKLRIGVQALEEDFTPPGQALGRRGIVTNIIAFDSTAADPAAIVRAVAQHKVDVSIVWGPLAGYVTKHERLALQLNPVTPEVDPPGLPMTFAIAMGVRQDDAALRDALDAAIERRRGDIDAILDRYGVPRIAGDGR